MPGKTVSPPPLPQDVLARVLRVASTDGRILLIIAGAFAMFAASIREAPGTIAGVLAAGAGALELHGAGLLQRGEARGMRWLIVSQLALLAVVLGYVAARFAAFDPDLIQRLITPEMEAEARAAGLDRAGLLSMLSRVYHIGYTVLAIATVCYQGGMARFFYRRRPAVHQALGGSVEAR